MKDQIFNLDETKFLDVIQEFFGTKTVINQLTFIDKWMELILNGKIRKRFNKPGELYFFYDKINSLFDYCHEFVFSPETFKSVKKISAATTALILLEKKALSYFPYQLKEKDLLNPAEAIKNIFKHQSLQSFKQALKKWYEKGLNSRLFSESTDFIMPLYANIKKLISLCWLINERAQGKNSFEKLIPLNPLHNYALTDPFLFKDNEVENPFSTIEFFFNFTNLSGYRDELQQCYIAAMSSDFAHKRPCTLFYIHNQYISLIQAGYLIVSKKLSYKAEPNKYAGKTLGAWLLSVRDQEIDKGELAISDEAPHVLSMQERKAPMDYCISTLTYENVIKIRAGLQEWLNAGLSDNSGLHYADTAYAYELYLTLQKLTEAFYLIITANATIDSSLNTANQ
ncbi:MAG: hypothetical protein EOO47_18520 [Flavobacterium sp.]|nr:MAG: hypothetical protein EOO47_18520 [Flavobacterium sp.]